VRDGIALRIVEGFHVIAQQIGIEGHPRSR
jgi:hypothetical protein